MSYSLGLAIAVTNATEGRGPMADEGEPRRSYVLDIEAHSDGTQTTLTLVGEFDMSGTGRFSSFLSEALAAGPRSVTIDASGLEFIDSSGLNGAASCP